MRKKKHAVKGKAKGKAPIKGTKKDYLRKTMSEGVDRKLAIHKQNVEKIKKIKPAKD